MSWLFGKMSLLPLRFVDPLSLLSVFLGYPIYIKAAKSLVKGKKEGSGAVPLVFIGQELLSAGGKVSVPAIRRRLEALGLTPSRRV